MNHFGVKHKSWKQPQMRMQLTCAGGCLGGRTEPVEAAQHPVTRNTFVKLIKSARWLQRFVTSRIHHSALQPTTLLETLTAKFNGSDHGDGPPDAEDARMEELAYDDDDDADGDSPPDASAAINPKIKRIPINAIVTIDMPEICPTAHVNPDERIRGVKLWNRGGRGRRGLWIAMEDVEWAVSYMRVELDTLGVAPLDETDDSQPISDAGDSQSPAIQVQSHRWDFPREAWAIESPGQQTIFFGIAELTADDIPVDHGASSMQAYLQTLGYDEKKELARRAALRRFQ